jgi:enoyl-CoA hydratase/carnithine racemase
MEYGTILYDDSAAPVARIILNRPDKKNPIGPATCGELVHAFARAGEDAAVRCVVVTGAGKVFSAGGDLGMMSGQGSGKPGEEPPVKPASFVELFAKMHALGKPIIAMLNGHALAGGMGLAVACDLVIASEAAELGTTEINLGLWPMMITAEIVRSIGRKKALELMLTGDKIPAREAERIGLVNRVVAAEKLEEETMGLARKLASKSPSAMRLGLRAFYDTQDMDLESALVHLRGQLGMVLGTEDAAEGIAAFFQKREPVWKGR